VAALAGPRRATRAISAPLQCLTGCAIGEIVGTLIGTAAGFSNLVTIVLSDARPLRRSRTRVRPRRGLLRIGDVSHRRLRTVWEPSNCSRPAC